MLGLVASILPNFALRPGIKSSISLSLMLVFRVLCEGKIIKSNGKQRFCHWHLFIVTENVPNRFHFVIESFVFHKIGLI